MNKNIDFKIYKPSTMERLEVDGAEIEYLVQGEGEPVLLIPPAVTIDGLGVPLLTQPEIASCYQLIHYHRRGYMGSTPGAKPLTVALQARDAAMLLRHLKVKTAHVAGHSIGGNIALQLAFDAPDLVHSLALLEPALPMIPDGKKHLGDLFLPVLDAYRSGNKRAAIEIFCNATYGPNWQTIAGRIIPGIVDQAVIDADVTMQDLQSIPAWQFGPQDAAAIRKPVLSVLGTRPNPFMKQGRELIHSWFPQAEDLDVPTTHLLQMQDPIGVAHGLAEFFGRHQI